MKKLKVIENFTLKDYDKLIEVIRKDKAIIGKLFIDDVIICDDNMAGYLLGNNPLHRAVVELIEDIPEVIAISQSPIEDLEQTNNEDNIEKVNTTNYEKSKKKKKASK